MKNLKASLPATMAGIASKEGLKLAFGQPRTDGKTVWVSDIPLNPSEDDYNIVVSDLIHEVGHIKFTDFNLNRGGHPLMPALTNVFEDVRIEKALQNEFLGARNFLDEGYKIITSNGQYRQPDTPANALTMWLLLDHMIKVNGRSFWQDEREKAYQSCLTFGVSVEILNAIENLCDSKVDKLSSTADCIVLSKEVIDLLQQPQQESEQSNASGESETGNDSSTSKQGGNTKDDKEGIDGQSNSAETGKDSGKPTKGSDQKSNGSSPSTPLGSKPDNPQEAGAGFSQEDADKLLNSDVNQESPISLREAAQGVVNQISPDNSLKSELGESGDIAQSLRNASQSGQNFSPNSVEENMPCYCEIRDLESSSIMRLKKVLSKRWSNESKTRQRINEFDGRFDSREAIRCHLSGENDFLIKKSKKINHKPAVCIVADLSGSMSKGKGSKAWQQARALIVISEACNAAGIPLNIMGFSSKVIPIKEWNVPIAKTRATLGGMTKGLGSTNIDKAVFEGVRALSVRKEQKKILITMTDGAISGYQGDAVKNLLKYAESHVSGKFEAYGLGIGANIANIFTKGGKIQPNQMPESILDILVK